MANPQKENGHVKIANEIVEAFARHRLSGNEWQVLWVILRKTYGWNKKSDAISLSQIAKMTGISRPHVAHAVAKLCARGVAKKSNTYVSTYELQKDYSKWKVLHKKAPRCLNVQPLLPKRATKLLPKTAHTKDTKDTSTKDKIKDSTQSSPSAHSHDLNSHKPVVHRLIEMFGEAYLASTGGNYIVDWGRDGKIMKTLSKSCNGNDPLEFYGKIIESFFSSKHKFKGNYDIPTFKRSVNRLQAENTTGEDAPMFTGERMA